MIIDTHAHLFWESFEADFDSVIQNALDAGVTEIINVGVDVATSQKSAQMTSDKIKFYSSIGIHPEEASKYLNDKGQITNSKLENDIAKLEEIYRLNPQKVIAVGECGLDFSFRETDPDSEAYRDDIKKIQIKLLQAQIDLAKKLNLPLLIHCRDDRSKNPQNTECWDTVIEMTKDHFGIYHCYSGLPLTTNYLLRTTNFYISFAGNITYPKNEYLREAAKIIPLERMVIETDCPFLPPQTHRGTRNEPAYITETLKCISEIKDLPLEETARTIFENTTRLLTRNRVT